MEYPVIDYINQNYNAENDNKEFLPFMHSCEGFTLESIIEDGELKLTKCPVFNEDLLYFFYGKPSYRVGQNIKENRTDCLYSPCCLIFKSENVNIAKVYPFDSGGYQNGIYEDYFHKKMKIDQFELEQSLYGISKYINVFFQNNNEYLYGRAKNNNHTNSYINSLSNLLMAEGSHIMDERSRTIEVITEENIELENNLIGIVLPFNLMRVDNIINFIKKMNIKYETYYYRALTRPVEYNQAVFERVMKIIGKNEVI